MTIQRPDVLVIGAGTAGAAAAARLAEGGCSVVLADRRPAEEAGAHWINAVPGWLFDEAAVSRPEPPELIRSGGTHASVLADSEGRVYTVVASDPGLHVDMAPLTRRLLQRALDAGVTFLQGRVVGIDLDHGRPEAVTLATAEGPSRNKVSMQGVGASGSRGAPRRILIDMQREATRRAGMRQRPGRSSYSWTGPETHAPTTIRPRLTVDASGAAGAIRRRVPDLANACPAPSSTDICLAAQYQHRITDRAGAQDFLEAHNASPGDSITRMGVVGGYSILLLNISEELTEVGILSGSIPADGVPSGQAIVDRFVDRTPWIGQRLTGGQAPIPLGQPYTRITAPGVALVGNAANHVYALHGSGVGMGLVAARLVADAATGGRDPGDAHGLHRYAHRFLRTYGGRLAGSDLFRRYSQTQTRDEISSLLRSGMVGGPMLAAGLLQKPFETDPQSLLTVTAGALRHPRLALRLAPTAIGLLRLQAAFEQYPDQPDPRALGTFEARLARIRGF